MHRATCGETRRLKKEEPSVLSQVWKSGVRTYAIHGFSKQIQVLTNIILACKRVRDCSHHTAQAKHYIKRVILVLACYRIDSCPLCTGKPRKCSSPALQILNQAAVVDKCTARICSCLSLVSRWASQPLCQEHDQRVIPQSLIQVNDDL